MIVGLVYSKNLPPVAAAAAQLTRLRPVAAAVAAWVAPLQPVQQRTLQKWRDRRSLSSANQNFPTAIKGVDMM